MPANLRSKPIEGHVTDSAGNVIRNGTITVKINTAVSTQVVATTKTNDEGYFITSPLPCGVYLIYESGVLVSQVVHPALLPAIQCYKAAVDDYFPEDNKPFETLRTTGKISNFKIFIQIENVDFDPVLYGSSYPLYDFQILHDSEDVVSKELYYMGKFFNLGEYARITTTRFDVEYFSQLTATEKNYKRVRWSGVPAIRFKEGSRLVIPLDYFSIVPSLPRLASNNGRAFEEGDDVKIDEVGESSSSVVVSGSGDTYDAFYDSIAYGDIVKIITTDAIPKIWYGILTSRDDGLMTFYKWPSSVYTSSSLSADDEVKVMYQYDGMFQGLQSIDQLAFERFTVMENANAQNSDSEAYNYSLQIGEEEGD